MRALALKYRPNTFDDVTEQGATIDILESQIETSTFKQSVLFVGSAGTGKTTCARIFANEINGGKGSPVEMDAASNNGVDDVREIAKMAQVRSVDSPYRVFILDEVHMFSAGAWAAMLKLIEEPPARCVFILCTTDYWKIPKTILSRCQRFDFQKISPVGIVSRLKHIADIEGIVYEDDALEFIARVSDGCMREAITNLDKCLSYSDHINLDVVTDTLGMFDYDIFVDLTNDIVEGNPKEVVAIIEEVYSKGKDMRQFIKAYFNFIVDVSKYELTGNINYTQLPNKSIIDTLDMEFELTDGSPIHFKSIMNVLAKLDSEIKWIQNPKNLITATLLGECL